MYEIIIDDLSGPLNDAISKKTLSKIPKQNNGTNEHWTSLWRYSEDGKHHCLECFHRVN